jgi:hypothetical protein
LIEVLGHWVKLKWSHAVPGVQSLRVRGTEYPTFLF